MSTAASPTRTESRIQPRLSIAAMYSLLRVRPAGSQRYCWTGYIYDMSLNGMRFELDEPLEPGAEIEVRGMLPGAYHITFRATGRVVRLHDDADEPGPIRMAMTFTHFAQDTDRRRVTDYLNRYDSSATRLAA